MNQTYRKSWAGSLLVYSGFDLWPFFQGQMRIDKLKCAHYFCEYFRFFFNFGCHLENCCLFLDKQMHPWFSYV